MNRDGQIKHQTLPFFSTDVNGRPWWRIIIHQQRRQGEVLDTKVRIRSFEYEGENQMQIAVTKGILLRLLLYALSSLLANSAPFYVHQRCLHSTQL